MSDKTKQNGTVTNESEQAATATKENEAAANAASQAQKKPEPTREERLAKHPQYYEMPLPAHLAMQWIQEGIEKYYGNQMCIVSLRNQKDLVMAGGPPRNAEGVDNEQ